MSEPIREWVSELRRATIDTAERPTILVPFELFRGESIPPGTFELLAETHVVLLGYFKVPDQTAPGQASMQFEERGEQLLEDLSDRFEEAGAVVDSLLCFTRDPDDSVARIAMDFDCEARLIINQVADVEDVLLAVTADLDTETVIGIFGAMFLQSRPTVHLLDIGKEVSPEAVDRVRRTLVSIGFDDEDITVRDARARRPVPRVVEAAADVDVVVITRQRHGLETYILGDRAKRIAKGYVGPVLVIYEKTGIDSNGDDTTSTPAE